MPNHTARAGKLATWVLVFGAASAPVLSQDAQAPSQARAPSSSTALSPAPSPSRSTEQRIERLTFEDAGSRVDELRVGGQTQVITVQPKADVPAYEVRPSGAARGASQDDRMSAPGQRVWNVLKF